MNYNQLIEDCFFQPRHVGVLDCSQKGVVSCHVGNTIKGSYFDLYGYLDNSGKIVNAYFKAQGNPYLIAGVEWVCRQLEGSLIDEHPKLDHPYLIKKLAIPMSHYPVAILIAKGYFDLVIAMKKIKRIE